jgi:ABC-type polysaccharide/polyol phosphate transport system ATPase subunit
MLLVSHDPRTVTAYCHRALLLEGGRIVMDGKADAVAARYVAMLTEPLESQPVAL